ncbi:MAG: hypothetical protein AB8B63_01180 [Granulosicoccus sp.]
MNLTVFMNTAAHHFSGPARLKTFRSMTYLLASLTIVGCNTPGPVDSYGAGIPAQAIAPRINSNDAVIENTDALERAHLQLIATNLVSTLVQVPGMQSSVRTLQISAPQSAFGHVVVRALEDAGYGLQLVSADQGQYYVSYSKRLSETESGWVTDYALRVANVQVSREYSVSGNTIYPSSLMIISGVDDVSGIELTDRIFAEQGGDGHAFVSGLQIAEKPDPTMPVSTIAVNDYDALPDGKRTPQKQILAEAQQRFFEMDARRAMPDLEDFAKYRRTVLMFSDTTTRVLGNGNKRAVALLSREFASGDIMVIKACQDADGANEQAMGRAIRVEQELTGLGVPGEQTYIAPCTRTNYRHASDDSPTPVELIHYRPQS